MDKISYHERIQRGTCYGFQDVMMVAPLPTGVRQKTSMMAEDIGKMREFIKLYLVCIWKDQARPSARAWQT